MHPTLRTEDSFRHEVVSVVVIINAKAMTEKTSARRLGYCILAYTGLNLPLKIFEGSQQGYKKAKKHKWSTSCSGGRSKINNLLVSFINLNVITCNMKKK